MCFVYFTWGQVRSHTGGIHWAMCSDVSLSCSWEQLHFSHPCSHSLPTGWTTPPTTHTSGDKKDEQTRHFIRRQRRENESFPIQTGTHFVWQAAGFRAAAVIGRRGCDEASGAGVCGVLAVARTFKRVTALCLFRWQLAMCRAFWGRLMGALLLFAHWQGGEVMKVI